MTAQSDALNKTLAGTYTRYVKQPDYAGRMGFLHLVEEDMRRVFELLVDKEHPAVIFIDDLDRCFPSKVGQVVEAVNLFLAGNYPGCVFVLGFNAHVVAASMETLHNDIIKKLDVPEGGVGWRFMDKSVQLPFVIPRLTPDQRKTYLKRLLRKQDITDPLPPEMESEAQDILSGVHADKLDLDIAACQLAEIATNSEPSSKLEEYKEEVISAGAQRFSDEDPEMTNALEKQVAYLYDNPRTIKRVINLYRFHRFMSWARKMSGMGYAAPEDIARSVVVIVCWPFFVRWLQGYEDTESSKEKGQKLITMVIQKARSCENVEDWTKALETEGINYKWWGNNRDLWRFLREPGISGETLLRAYECGLW